MRIWILTILIVSYSCHRNENLRLDKDNMLTQPIELKSLSGWWKLTDATYKPIHLINAGYANNFTIHFAPDGRAAIFKENNLDSIVEYKWKIDSNRISLSRLCIAGSNSPIYFLSDKKMIMSFDEKKMDTLVFKKSEPLTKK